MHITYAPDVYDKLFPKRRDALSFLDDYGIKLIEASIADKAMLLHMSPSELRQILKYLEQHPSEE